ncbi:MAG: GlsB/YeaQ/YmgE family stress response membrane protein [Thermomonas sp.]
MDPVGLIIWLVIGGIIGWLASMIMKTDGQQGILLNVVVGIIGSFLGGWLIAPLIGGTGIMGYISALIGAVILLAIVNLFRRGRVR